MTSMSLNIVIQHLITLMYMSLYNVIQFVMQYEKNNTRPLNKYLAIKKRKIKFIVHVSLHRTNTCINVHTPVLNCRLVEL